MSQQGLNLVLRISGDASGLKAEVVGATRDVQAFGQGAASAGQQASAGFNQAGTGAAGAARQIAVATSSVDAFGRSASAAQGPLAGLNLRLAAGEAATGLLYAGARRLSALLQGALFGGVAGVAMQVASYAFGMLRARESTDDLTAAQTRLHDALRQSIQFFETAAERARRMDAEQRNALSAQLIPEQMRIDGQRARIGARLAELQPTVDQVQEARRLGGDDTRIPAAAQRRFEEAQRLRGQLDVLEFEAAALREQRALIQVRPSGAQRDADERAARGGRPEGGSRGPAADDPLRRLMQDGQRLAEQMRTPFEAMEAQLARYRQMLAEGAIDQETFNRAVAALNDQAREPFDRLMAGLDPATAALREYAAQQDVIRDAIERNIITEEEYADAVRRSSEALGRRLQRAQEDADGTTDAQRLMADATRQLGMTFTSAFENAILGGKGFGEILKALEQDIARMIIRLLIIEPMMAAMRNAFSGGAGGAGGGGGIIGGLISALFRHTGGMVGAGDGPQRAVPAALFADAPRFHTGGVLAPGEVPAVLQQGEGVFTPAQMAALAPVDALVGTGGGTAVNVNISVTVPVAPGGADDGQSRRQLAEMIAAVVDVRLRQAIPGIIGAAQGAVIEDADRGGTVAKKLGRR